jgi:hypothetical protein
MGMSCRGGAAGRGQSQESGVAVSSGVSAVTQGGVKNNTEHEVSYMLHKQVEEF